MRVQFSFFADSPKVENGGKLIQTSNNFIWPSLAKFFQVDVGGVIEINTNVSQRVIPLA